VRALAVLVLFVLVAEAPAQTIQERAAEVRRSLEGDAADVRRTIQSPPPIETVIDRGTRVVVPTPPPPQPVSPATVVNSQPAGQANVPVSSGIGTATNRLNVNGLPAASAPVIDPRSTTRITLDPRTAGLRNFPPGVLVIHGAKDGQVSGASNLFTGSGVSSGAAP
jgi:hypothetical protein